VSDRHGPTGGQRVAGALERLIRPSVIAFGRRWSSFKLLGCAGAALGALVGAAAAALRGLSLGVVAAMIAVSLAVAVLQYAAVWRLGGSRRLVYYRYEIAIVVVLAGGLAAVHQPVAAYLDVAVLGIGAFLVAGRLGCFTAGCCHGIPHRLGVRYGTTHVPPGFASHLAHVRLLPVQIAEAAGTLAMVIAGLVALRCGAAPGWVFSAWVVAYGVGRFHLELVRGDAARRYLAGFSEAQWTSLLVMAASIAAGAAGWMPVSAWHAGLAAVVGLEILATAGWRVLRGTGAHLLSQPRHVDELARLIHALGAARPEPPRGTLVGTTSLGIGLSLAPGEHAGEPIRIFTLSRSGGPLAPGDARTLARWLARLDGAAGAPVLERRDSGVVHVLLRSAAGAAVSLAEPVAPRPDPFPSAAAARFELAAIAIHRKPSR